MDSYKMWIDGQWAAAASGKTYKVINPATEAEIAEVPMGDASDVNRAVAAAKQAFPAWARKSQGERSRIVDSIAEAIRENAEELAWLDVTDHGTPLTLARGMVMGAAHNFEYAARTAKTIMGDVLPVNPDRLICLHREPIGVNAIITPWNSPLLMVAAKMGPSLALGNTCVVKPPTIDSLAALKLAEILDEMNLPPGIANIITGPGGVAGDALASHPDVQMVAFTGSCETGKQIMATASRTMKRIIMELGGKNPTIVLEDGDVDAAVARGVESQLSNTGQVCGSPGRFYIHKKRHDEFVEKFLEGARNYLTGDPADPKTQMGPLVSAEHRASVEGYIRKGVEEGATLVLGGKRPTEPPLDKGYYVMPTVFTGVKQDMTIAREEIFGPVAVIMEPFTSEEAVIEMANDNTFGLCAQVWTDDTPKGIRFAKDICAGSVWVNNSAGLNSELPWGGFKESGIGKEGSVHGLHEYTQLKMIAADLAAKK